MTGDAEGGGKVVVPAGAGRIPAIAVTPAPVHSTALTRALAPTPAPTSVSTPTPHCQG